MSTAALLWTLSFTALAAVLSVYQRLGLERDIAVGAVRAGVQLLAVGYVLRLVFRAHSWLYTGLMLTVMVAAAVQVATRRGGGMPGTRSRVAVAIAAAEIVTVGLMLVTGQIRFVAEHVIPLSGMVVGQSMVTAGLLLNRLRSEVGLRREEVQVWLSLGASPRQAVDRALRSAVRASMIPSIDSLKTVGLVQLPGMMTGQILAGADPVVAVRYQILVMFSLTSAAALTSILLGLLAYPLLFTPAQQLRPIEGSPAAD
ncbi:ABC transporter permease [Caldinitratiruptor microaerophilus]|uniref:UPF0014 membrane protein YjkA n=1 Tax=Caldinitratiruptor microaerophilus TaxID=671077 RepID=A0AA35CM44_9FIRM|nr:iron export ABC transporter permease subunit FetB [Caldinitratiruptor microaerophilus]BDG60999.1 UPF0014 membrane protein YjkA [Caldinitratiruptor microaerophilus]